MENIRRRSVLLYSFVLCFVFLFCHIASAQTAPLCDVECAPNPISSTYGTALATRPKLLNARGSSSPIVPIMATASASPTLPGSQSFNQTFPVLSLPGRQDMDLSLNLYYNSRVWDIDPVNSTATFNIDRDFPSYGFRLDFGFLEYDPTNDQYIVTESDGTKHVLPNSGSNYDSTDGTYMRYTVAQKVLTYKNGTQVYYQVFPSQASQSVATLLRPTVSRNANGNFITIAYVTGKDQALSSITDTLNRVINFNYDASNRLTSVSQNIASGTKNWITFTWGTITLDYNYSLAVHDSPASGSTVNVITKCTYPNGTGYTFHYGHWGMINRIDTVSSSGALRSYISYNFPDTSSALSDAPAYTQQTVSPDGTAQLIWNYVYTSSGTGVVTSMTVTDPNGNKSVTSLDGNGLVISAQAQNSVGTPLRTTGYVWTTAGVGTVPSKITSTLNDTAQQSSNEYSYDTYGNATDVYEYDFGHQLRRHTVTTFLGGGYIPWWHILNLPTRIVVIDGVSGTTVSRTDLNYDEYSVTPMTSVTGATNHDDGYNTTVTTRGNLTSIVRYSNASAGTGAISRAFTYDTLGNVLTAQLDCCNQKTFNFSSLNQYAYPNSVVRGTTAPLQFTTSYTYDNDTGLTLTSTDENGQQTQYQYDSMERSIQTKLPAQNGTVVQLNTTYDDAAALPTVTNSNTANSAKSLSTFNGLGWLLQSDTKADTTLVSSVTYSYDGVGRRTRTSNPFATGDTLVYTTTSYDGLGRVTIVAPPSGGSQQYVYAGNSVTITDPAGKQRQLWTDALGRVKEVDEPGWGDALPGVGSVTISGSEGVVQVCQDTQPPICNNVYDSGTVSLTVNGLAKSAGYGRATLATDISSALASAFNSDSSASVTATVSGATIALTAKTGGANTNYSISSTSSTNDPTDFGGASFSGVASGSTLTGGENAVTQANAVLTTSRRATTTYTYDVFDDLISVSQAAMGPVGGQQLAGQSRSSSYDNLGRQTSTTTPETGTITTYYTDVNGNACAGDISLSCRVQDARGIVKTFTYDGINRLTGVQYSDTTPSEINTYDTGGAAAFALGRLVKVTEGTNTRTYGYDVLGRITAVSNVIDQTTYPVSYIYNLAGQLTSITYPSGRVVTQNIDNIGRLSSIASGSTTYLSGITFNAAGNALGLTLGNGVQGTLGYNDHLQISSLRYFKSGASTDILNLAYDYTNGVPGNNGQIQAVRYYTSPGTEDPRGSEYFNYDPLGRLSSAHTGVVSSSTPGTWSLSWGYDRFGNRLSQTLNGGNLSVYQPNFTVDPATNRITGYQYDNAGNLTSDGVNTFTYDGANRMTKFDTSGASYTYFGALRVKRIVGANTSVYIYSGNNPIAEYLNGALSAENIYSGSQLLAVVTPSSTTYYHPDHLSTRAQTDATGAVTLWSGTLPFGDTWYVQGNSTKWKFTSYERDVESGSVMDYAQFRFYHSAQGRFMSADPLGGEVSNPQSFNRYTYVGNDPVNLVDPLGLVSPVYPHCDFGQPLVDKGGHLIACIGGADTINLSVIVPLVGGPSGPGPNIVNLPALIKCILKMFNVTGSTFTLVTKQSPGVFTGQTQSGGQISLSTDGTTYSTSDLSRISRRNGGPDVTGLTLDGFTWTRLYWGGTFSYKTSYVGSDLSPGSMLDNQIHELAHQLAQALGKAKVGTPESEKIATDFQQCYVQNAKQKK